MKRVNLWAIVVLCYFFTQQIFAFSGDVVQPDEEINSISENQQEEIIQNEVVPDETEESDSPVISLEDTQEVNYSSTGTTQESDDLSQEHSGEVVNETEEITEVDNNEMISDEENEYSQTGSVTQTGTIIEDDDGELIENDNNEEEINNEFLITFQNPSYILEKNEILNEYICDSEKDECKVNVILRDIQGDNLGSQYECRIEYSTLEEISETCNPTTVIFSETTTVNYLIKFKDSQENLFEKNITFIVENSGETPTEESEELSEGEESTGTGSALNGSGTVVGPDIGATQTGTIVDPELVEDEILLALPKISVTVQSGLDFSGTGNIYICTKQDCKINLDVSDSFSGELIESNYSCSWDFGSGTFSTNGTHKKCNPGYVDYDVGIHFISIKIFDKQQEDNFTQLEIQINNVVEVTQEGKESDLVDENEIIEENNQETGTGGIIGTGVVIEDQGEIMEEFTFPNILLDIQSGAEFIDSNRLKCNKQECKINLDISNSFTGVFDESNYLCEWNFEGGFFSDATKYKCNPGYIDYTIGNYDIELKIYQKDNSENFVAYKYYLDNPEQIKTVSRKSSGGSIKSTQVKDYGLISEQKEIIVQSGLEYNQCNSEKCKINLNYENASYESCNWDFGDIDVNEKYTTTCNPGFIYVNAGVYVVKLDVFNDKTHTHYRKELFFSNTYISHEIEVGESDFDIILQGKLVDYKQKIGDKIVCMGVDKCNINLDLDAQVKGNYRYTWNMGNGDIVEKKNPGSHWYNSGSYQVDLQILGENIELSKQVTIEVIPKEKQVEEKYLVEEFNEYKQEKQSIFYSLKDIKNKKIELGFYKDFLPQGNTLDFIGNSWFGESNIDETKLKLTRNIAKQKKSLKYSGTTFPNSQIYILQGDNIIEIKSDGAGKYSYKNTDFSAGEYDLEYYVLDSNGNLYQSNNTKSLDVTQAYVDEVKNNVQKAISSSRVNSSKKTINISKIEDAIVEKSDTNKIIDDIDISSVEIEAGSYEYILQIFLGVLTLLGSIFILRRYSIL